jgi:hypothetical protein
MRMLGDDLREQREGRTEEGKREKRWRFPGETLRRNDPVARIRYSATVIEPGHLLHEPDGAG